MFDPSLGFIIVFITFSGYVSNWLNWHFLNYRIMRLLYYIGAFVHEASHAILCVLTGARIEEFRVFSEQPHVAHQKPRVPIVGNVLISAAPIAGGILFLFFVNHYFLGDYFVMPHISAWQDWQSFFSGPLRLLSQINLLQWQSWVMILLFFNVGAMLGPSGQDLKNFLPLLIILFFVHSAFLTKIGLVALGLIVINIALQIIAIAVFKAARGIRHLLI